jgi:hypothetical protein
VLVQVCEFDAGIALETDEQRVEVVVLGQNLVAANRKKCVFFLL